MRIFFLIFLLAIIQNVEAGWQVLPKTNFYADSTNVDKMSLSSDGKIWLLVFYNTSGIFGSIYNETTAAWTSHTIDSDSDCRDSSCQVDVDFDRTVNTFRVLYQVDDEDVYTRTAVATKTSTLSWSNRVEVKPLEKKDKDGSYPRISNVGDNQWVATRRVDNSLRMAKIFGNTISPMIDERIGMIGYRGNVDSTPGPAKTVLMVATDLSGRAYIYWTARLDICCDRITESPSGSNTNNYNPNIAYDESTNKFFITRRRENSDKIFVSEVLPGSNNFGWDKFDYSFGTSKCNYPDISISNGLMVVIWHEGSTVKKITAATINTATKRIFDTTSLTNSGSCSSSFPIITSNNRKFMSCWIDCWKNIVCGIRSPTPSFSVSILPQQPISSGTISTTVQTSSITITFNNTLGEDSLIVNKITFNSSYIIIQDPLPFTVAMGQQSNFKLVWKGGPAYSVTSATFETNIPTNNVINFAITAVPNMTVIFSNVETPSTVNIILPSRGGVIPFVVSNNALGTASISISIENNPSTLNLITPTTLSIPPSSLSNATFNFTGTANSTYILIFQCSPNCIVPRKTISLNVTISTDCVWTQWSPFYPSDCDESCTGSKVSTRTAIPPTGNGAPCVGNDTETTSCDKRGCPVDCEASLWSNWSPCSTSCNQGISTRDIRIIKYAENGGIPCPDRVNETISCNLGSCPTNCEWGDWSSFSLCDVGCGNGTQTQTRITIVNATNGGLDCEGPSTNSTTCYMGDCDLVDCVWNPWSPWSECSSPCGGGTTIRSRTFISKTGVPCDGPSNETELCNTDTCPPDCLQDPTSLLIRCYNNTIKTNGSVTLEGDFITGNLVVTKHSTVILGNSVPVLGNFSFDDSSAIYFSSNYTVDVANCANFGGNLVINVTGVKNGEIVPLFSYKCATGQFQSYEIVGGKNTTCSSQVANFNYSQSSVSITFSTVNSCQDTNGNDNTLIITGSVIGGVLVLTIIIILISKHNAISRIIFPYRLQDGDDPDYV